MRRLLSLAAAVVLLGAAAAPAAPSHTHIAFKSTDGVTLRGQLWVGGPTAVVFSHMFGTDQSIWFDLAGRLAGRGFTVLTFDFRGVGRSGGRLVIRHVSRDTLAAVRFIRARNPSRIVLIGASMGGTSSLIAAGRSRVDGVVVIASGMSFQGLDARPYLATLRTPKLFIVGSRDAPFNESVKMMYARSAHPKQLLALPTAVHGTYLFRTRHKDTIYGAIFDFLRSMTAGK